MGYDRHEALKLARPAYPQPLFAAAQSPASVSKASGRKKTMSLRYLPRLPRAAAAAVAQRAAEAACT